MKAVVLSKLYDPKTGTLGEVGCREVPIPEIVNDDDVLLKIAYASICGSDLNALKGFFPNKKLNSLVGHEVSGTIEKLGPAANQKGLKIGDKVTGNFYLSCNTCYYCRTGRKQFCEFPKSCNGTMAQYIVWRESQVYKLPDSINLDEATLTEPFTIAVRAIEMVDMKLGSNLAISGGGGIGLMLVQLAKMSGASTVSVIEPVEYKRKLALQLGADYAIDAINDDIISKSYEITGGHGFDAILETSGNSIAAETCIKIAAKAGHILYFSMYNANYNLPLNLLENCYHKELRIQGMFLAQDSFPQAIAMLPRMNFKPLISKVYPLDKCKQAYEDALTGGYVKILFNCQN